MAIQSRHLIFQRLVDDFRQMLSSIETNDITDARGQVQYTSLGNRTLNKFIDILSSVPERQKLRLIFYCYCGKNSPYSLQATRNIKFIKESCNGFKQMFADIGIRNSRNRRVRNCSIIEDSQDFAVTVWGWGCCELEDFFEITSCHVVSCCSRNWLTCRTCQSDAERNDECTVISRFLETVCYLTPCGMMGPLTW